jgi:hypothetical protein
MTTNPRKLLAIAAMVATATLMLLLTAYIRPQPVQATSAHAPTDAPANAGVFDTCLLDNSDGSLFQFNSLTGQYQFTLASDGFTVSGIGVVTTKDNVRILTDVEAGRRVSAEFNLGQLTGSATISLVVAAGVSQTFRINATNPSNSCTCYPYASDYLQASCPPATSPSFVVQPDDIDWRPKGAVTPVKNQGTLKADWAFSATGALEGLLAVTGKGLKSLSEQQLLDCTNQPAAAECGGGGSPIRGFILAEQQGDCTEASYPYTATKGSCKSCSPVVHPSGHTIVCPGEDNLAQALNQSPVSAVVISDWMPGFTGGGIVDAQCNTLGPHTYTAVVVVGYTADYWIVKNSLGASWGENGYFNLVRGKNACGISNFVAYPNFK